MCVICVTDPGKTLTDNEIENCWRENPDGAGFAFINSDNKFEVFKSMEKDEFANKLSDALEHNKDDSPFLIHFRIGTHGTKELENVHPFKVNRKTLFAHNGILSNAVSLIDKESNDSDTVAFNKEILSKLPTNFLRNRGSAHLIKNFIGNSNKLAFLNDERRVVVFNSHLGEEDDGRWFSNSSYKRSRPKYNKSMRGSNSNGYYKNGHWTPYQQSGWQTTKHDRLVELGKEPEVQALFDLTEDNSDLTQIEWNIIENNYFEDFDQFQKEGGKITGSNSFTLTVGNGSVYFEQCRLCGGFLRMAMFVGTGMERSCLFCVYEQFPFSENTAWKRFVQAVQFEKKVTGSKWYDVKEIFEDPFLMMEAIYDEDPLETDNKNALVLPETSEWEEAWAAQYGLSLV